MSEWESSTPRSSASDERIIGFMGFEKYRNKVSVLETVFTDYYEEDMTDQGDY